KLIRMALMRPAPNPSLVVVCAGGAGSVSRRHMHHKGSTMSSQASSPATDQPATTPRPTRDASGRFVKNNPGGPGNPYAHRVAALRSALLERVTEEDIHPIAARLVELARSGDVSAARLLFSYSLGKPAEAADPDGLDLHEWSLLRQGSAPTAEVMAPFNGLPVG